MPDIYTPIGLQDGDVLHASHIAHIEDGIEAIEDELECLTNTEIEAIVDIRIQNKNVPEDEEDTP